MIERKLAKVYILVGGGFRLEFRGSAKGLEAGGGGSRF